MTQIGPRQKRSVRRMTRVVRRLTSVAEVDPRPRQPPVPRSAPPVRNLGLR
jgi:hypothetical protein